MLRYYEKILQVVCLRNSRKIGPPGLSLELSWRLRWSGAIYGYGVARTVVSTNEIFSLPGDPVIKKTEEVDPGATAQPTKAPEASLPTPEAVGMASAV